MSQSRSHGAYRARQADAIDIELGNEPPLSVDGGEGGFIDRRRISVQWFAGTILTALCGAALMGGAVFTSLDGQAKFASLPQQVEVVLRGALGVGGDKVGVPRKSDRLPTPDELSFSRHLIHISTIAHVGNHEVIRVRPFVHFFGNLALTASNLSADIPPYNPQLLLAESASGGQAASEPPAAEPDAEVAFVMRDLAPALPRVKIALQTPPEEVVERVREVAAWSRKAAKHIPVADNITGIKLAYASVSSSDPYAEFEARIVPENMTLLPKNHDKTTGGNPFNDRVIVVKKSDTVRSMLHSLGATDDEISAITPLLGYYGQDGSLKEGQKLRVLLSPIPDSKHLQPVRVIVADEATIDAVAALSDTGQYVAVDPRSIDNEVAESADENDEDATGGISLYQSIYETALRNHVPRPIIDDLIRIYSFDVDFQRKVQPGDSFDVLYAGTNKAPDADTRHDVLFAALTVGGEIKRLYRFRSPDDSLIDYYDESGKSAKKFLLRKPVPMGELTSGFGLRRHPLLGYVKMHTGVDWGAPVGTPIYAAGNGVIEKEGWYGGYGKFILIHHANGYETAYGHLSAYAKGLHDGEHVRQGEVIGFVGSTGLSTGSHLHFEIRVNGRFVDPMRIKLPHGRELHGPTLAAFEQERERLDKIIARKPARVASNAPIEQ